jgi:predicted Zn finger-like uncharacterized protein
MNPALAARCPACATVFRVVPDQLRVSAGWVRCGRCAEVFDASASLIDAESGGSLTLPDEVEAPLPAEAAPADAPEATGQDGAEPPQHRPAEPFSEAPVGGATEGSPQLADLPPPQADIGDGPQPPLDARADPDDQPSFLRRAERAARWRSPRVRATLWLVTLAAGVALLLQLAYAYRGQVAARWHAARPALEAVCAALGCTLDPVQSIDSLAVESSGLVRVEKSSLYRLAVTLRNRAEFEVAVPRIDLSLTDSQGRLMARRVIGAAEMGATQATLGAGRDLALQATLQAGAPGGEPVAGYTIEIFYP